MHKEKKLYEKPELKSIKMLEIGAVTCCRATVQTCATADKTSNLKAQRTSTTS